MSGDSHIIRDLDQLIGIYGAPLGRSLAKELDHVSEQYRDIIAASPFVVLATVGEEGTDCSPRGDPAPVAYVDDPKTVLLPDRRGNNRIDSLRNIVRDPRVSLLFLIPGMGETMRINGRAELTTDPALLKRFEIQGKLPRSIIRVHVERAYFQCQKALARSKLWDPASVIDRKTLPTAGQMQQRVLGPDFDGAAYDAAYPEHMKKTIY